MYVDLSHFPCTTHHEPSARLISREGLRNQLNAPETNFQLSEISVMGNPDPSSNLTNGTATIISGHAHGLEVYKEVSVGKFDNSFHTAEHVLNTERKLEEA
ncbi:hypothetical protein PQX77_022395 [Marasmius sp. AFHP31]|nr:hypothetical protein PQX77_022395 [Marasmius sp. AFHP31]